MEIWDCDDFERPIETYHGYLGHYYDGSFFAEPALHPLRDFDFRKYSELVEVRGGERKLRIALALKTITISFDVYEDVANVLDQLPTVKVYLDRGLRDAGPASGGTCLFFAAEGFSDADLRASIASLAAALKADSALLEKLHSPTVK